MSRVEVAIYATRTQRQVLKILAQREGVTIGRLLDDRFARNNPPPSVDSIADRA